ncbi:MAG: hypothetical protein JXD23_03720 [Spirochaetales bacterium]|nr:hypothetical protein [Spirochaetales bacterium]
MRALCRSLACFSSLSSLTFSFLFLVSCLSWLPVEFLPACPLRTRFPHENTGLSRLTHLTFDGYKTENTTIIEHGTLKTFLLTLYGARKTGKKRAGTDGGCHIVEPGASSREALIGAVKRGLYVRRVSGGRPNDKGDFSFIAKNSFLIGDGQLKHPVNESMISGNIFTLFKNLSGISRERVNFGTDIYPWVKAGGLVISGK